MKATIVIDTERCKACYYCVLVCPLGLIVEGDILNSKSYAAAKFVDPETKCTGCAVCYVACPDVAIEVFKANDNPSSREASKDKGGGECVEC